MVKTKNIYQSKYNYIAEIEEYVNTLNLDKSENTIKIYLSAIERFFDYLEIKDFSDIKNIVPIDCRKYQAKLKSDGLQPSSINTNIRPLKALFNWLVENKKLKNSPFDAIKSVKEPKKKRPILTHEEVELIINKGCRNLKDKLLIIIMVHLGLRISEVINLKISDIHDYKVTVDWKKSKGKKERTLYLTNSDYRLLREYLDIRKDKNFIYVFQSQVNKQYTPVAIRQKLNRIMHRAGFTDERVKEITPHTLRRTFCVNFIEKGTNMRVVQGMMGHSSYATTLIYATWTDEAIERAMRGNEK